MTEHEAGDTIFNQGKYQHDVFFLKNNSQAYCYKGDPGDAWYVVLSGRANIVVIKGFKVPRKVLVSTLQCGDGFGGQALVNDGPRTASVITATPTLLLRVEKSDYKRLLGFSKF